LCFCKPCESVLTLMRRPCTSPLHHFTKASTAKASSAKASSARQGLIRPPRPHPPTPFSPVSPLSPVSPVGIFPRWEISPGFPAFPAFPGGEFPGQDYINIRSILAQWQRALSLHPTSYQAWQLKHNARCHCAKMLRILM
jgi:hypothetical protein